MAAAVREWRRDLGFCVRSVVPLSSRKRSLAEGRFLWPLRLGSDGIGVLSSCWSRRFCCQARLRSITSDSYARDVAHLHCDDEFRLSFSGPTFGLTEWRVGLRLHSGLLQLEFSFWVIRYRNTMSATSPFSSCRLNSGHSSAALSWPWSVGIGIAAAAQCRQLPHQKPHRNKRARTCTNNDEKH
jgi:hypothetical protein